MRYVSTACLGASALMRTPFTFIANLSGANEKIQPMIPRRRASQRLLPEEPELSRLSL